MLINDTESKGCKTAQTEKLFLPLTFVLPSHSPEANTVAFLRGPSGGTLLISPGGIISNVTLVKHFYEKQKKSHDLGLMEHAYNPST